VVLTELVPASKLPLAFAGAVTANDGVDVTCFSDVVLFGVDVIDITMAHSKAFSGQRDGNAITAAFEPGAVLS